MLAKRDRNTQAQYLRDRTGKLGIAAFGAAVLTFPVMAWQVYRFVAPGLYQNERKALLPYLILSPILFFLGGALVYYFIFPMAWKFFLSFETAGVDGSLPIQLEAKVNEYLSLIMTLILGFGMIFQLPVVLTLLARAGILTAQVLREKRRWAKLFA